MEWLRRNGFRILGLTLLSYFAITVIRTVIAGPLSTPNARDIAQAQDVVAAPAAMPTSTENSDWLGGLGIVEPRGQEYRLSAGVAGRIAAVHVEEGQVVRSGTLLVELESGAEAALLAAAEADLAAANAGLLRSRRGLRPEDVAALTTDASAADTRARLSTESLTRLEAAAQGGAVTPDELDRARRQAEIDRLTAQTAVSRQSASQRGRSEDVMVAAAQVRAAQARVQQAHATLERLRIVAPIDGTVMEIHNRVGEFVQPGGAVSGAVTSEPIVVMGDLTGLRARIDVDERDIARVAVGAEARIQADAFGERAFSGRVVSIGHRMGRKNVRTDEPTERIDTKVLEVVVELADSTGLVPGLRVMGRIHPRN